MSEADIKPRIPAPPPEEEQLQIQVPGEGGAIWAVRIPRFLYDKWTQVDEGGVHLGTLVIDSS
jgi:transcription initiation factor TFIIF subunit beta